MRDDSMLVDSLNKSIQTDKKSMLNITDKRNFTEESLYGLLDASHVLEEKFYGPNSKENWMKKSFNIKPEDTKAMNDTLNKIRGPEARDSFVNEKGGFPEMLLKPGKRSEYTRKHIEKYKNNTFVNNLNSPSKQDADDAEDMYQSILKYKTVTDVIERHTKQKRNLFYQLINRFDSYFVETYHPLIQRAQKKLFSNGELRAISSKATLDLQQFIRIIFEGICSFYQLVNLEAESGSSERECLFNRDNLINFTTSLVFTNTIYEQVFEFNKLEEIELEGSYDRNTKFCSKLNPQDFGVPHEYCLNEKTISYFIKEGLIRNDLQTIREVQQSLEHGTPYFNFPQSLEGRRQSYSNVQESLRSESLSLRSEDELLTGLLKKYKLITRGVPPYQEAITMLANLKYRKSPIHKLKAIVKVAELITKNIEKFYSDFGLSNTKKIDADQTLSIFLYIATKSGVTDILAHCRIIEKFSTNNVLNSVSGYYATTLEACVNCICSMNFIEQPNTDRLSSNFKEFVQSVGKGSFMRNSLPNKQKEN